MGNREQNPHLNRAERRALKREEERKKKKGAANQAQAELIASLVSQKQEKKNEGYSDEQSEPASTPPKFKGVIGGAAGSLVIWFLTLCLSAPINYYGSRPAILYIAAFAFCGFVYFCIHKAVKLLNKSKWYYVINLANVVIVIMTFKTVESEKKKLAAETRQRNQVSGIITNFPEHLANIESGISNLNHPSPSGITWQPPEIPIDYHTATISLADYSVRIELDKLKEDEAFPLPGSDVIRIVYKQRRLYVQAFIGGFSHSRIILFTNMLADLQREDEIVNPNWDRNCGANVFEQVNEDTNPVFQVIYTRPNKIRINGTFTLFVPLGQRIPWYKGTWLGPAALMLFAYGTNSPEAVPVINTNATLLAEDIYEVVKSSVRHYSSFRQFKYPSWKYPGVLEERQQSTLASSVPSPTEPFIEGTEYTQKRLNEIFPFGYVVFFYGQNRIFRNEIFKNGLMDWTLDAEKVTIEPDFYSGTVTWKFPMPSGDSPNLKFQMVDSFMTLAFPMKKGCARRTGFLLGNKPVMHVMTLGDNQRTPVFAIGFRIPAEGEGRPPNPPYFFIQP